MEQRITVNGLVVNNHDAPTVASVVNEFVRRLFDNMMDLPWRNFHKSRVCDKFSEESTQAVYSTILSHGSISDSWYLVHDLLYK